MRHWQLQHAKARLSELIKSAETEGPQEISVHGEARVIVLSVKDYRRLARPKPNLLEFIQKSPWKGIELDLERDKSPARDVDL